MIVSYCVCEKCGRRGIAVEDVQDARCPSVGVLLAVCFECEDVEIRSGTPEQLVPGKEIRRRGFTAREAYLAGFRASGDPGDWFPWVEAPTPDAVDGNRLRGEDETDCAQCADPNLKGVHTCGKEKRSFVSVLSPGVLHKTTFEYNPEAECYYCTHAIAHTLDVCNRVYAVRVKGSTPEPEEDVPGDEQVRRRPPQDRVPVPKVENYTSPDGRLRGVLVSKPVGGEAEADCRCARPFFGHGIDCPKGPKSF